MSPQTEYLLLHDVVPRLRSAIPVAVAHVGSEDDAELLQDGTVMAAKILFNATRSGKRVTAGNVAYYTLQQLKSGRRTVDGSVSDVLGTATQLNGRSTVDGNPLRASLFMALSPRGVQALRPYASIKFSAIAWQISYITQSNQCASGCASARRSLSLASPCRDEPPSWVADRRATMQGSACGRALEFGLTSNRPLG
ncbi:MAG: hypothetical protein ABSC03_18565 [Verrucomicrobiota bacterium]|jgi:hypothetical protein